MRFPTLLLISLLPATVFAGVQKHTLTAALRAGLVEMRAGSNGNSYYQKAMQLELHNTTRDVLHLTVDPALIFTPQDTAYQDLVLPGSELLVVQPGKTLSSAVQSFCGKAHAFAPGASLPYNFTKQGDSQMIRVAQYIRKRKLHDALGQAAIWALTDHRNLDGIYDPGQPKESADLLAFMVKTTGWETPDYFKVYRLSTEVGMPVFQKRKLEIISNFELRLEQPKMLSMGVYNSAGKEVQVAFKGQQMRPGTYKLTVRFEAEGAAPGAYFLRVTEGAAVLREQQVVVE